MVFSDTTNETKSIIIKCGSKENFTQKSSKEPYCGGCGGGCGAVGCRRGGCGPSGCYDPNFEGGRNPLRLDESPLPSNKVMKCPNFCSCCPDNQPIYPPNKMPSPDYAAGNYNQVKAQLEYTDTTDLLPVGEMSMVGADGQVEQVINYDRMIYAKFPDRLYSRGDYIRGDLPIVPCKNEWFRPSVHPQLNLNTGALSVIAGDFNQTANELYSLVNASTAGLVNYGLGGSASNFGTVMKQAGVSGAGGDLQMTAFP